MKNKFFHKNDWKQYGMNIIGSLIFALGVNLIIVPIGLYSGGFLGISQIIRTLLIDYLNLPFFNYLDLSGIIYFLINIPLLGLAYKEMGERFFSKTIITIICQTIFLSVIKSPTLPVIEDPLTACLTGGIIAGFGSGIILMSGGSGGGADILGLHYTKKYASFSVGKIGIILNFFVYLICAFLFDIEIVIYSVIYTTFLSIMVDRVHYQNINMSVMIFTKKTGIAKEITNKMQRGVTNWDGSGAYTNETTHVMFTVITKYEVNHLKRIVKDMDPKAFMVFSEKMSVSGNFDKRLIDDVEEG